MNDPMWNFTTWKTLVDAVEKGQVIRDEETAIKINCCCLLEMQRGAWARRCHEEIGPGTLPL
jgi:hypothetical protein